MLDILPLLSLVFFAGIGTSFQPCLFPLLPTYFSYMNSYKKENINLSQSILVSIFLTLGILVVFLTLALLIKISQFWLSSFLINNVLLFNIIMSILLIIIGILMIIGFEFTFLYKVPGISTFIISDKPENNLIASFTLGLAYTAIAAPCAFPIFFSIWLQVIFLDPVTITLLMIIYSIGAGIPFLIIGLLYPNFGKEIRENYKNIAKYVKPFSGVILLLMALYLINSYVLPHYSISLLGYNFSGINKDFMNAIYINLFVLGVISLLLVVVILKIKHTQKTQNIDSQNKI